ncbi:MAG: DUF6036 family nucleotidyltransferase [Pseudomonadota bacterium]
MKKENMIAAFEALDAKLSEPLTLLVGGGAAMLLAHGIPLSTYDVDGLPFETKLSPAEVEKLIREVASELNLNPHWYNDYFNTFTFTLPADFRDRLVDVFNGKCLTVRALGAEDLLLMKCMAGRDKDVGHARALLRRGADWKKVEAHLEGLVKKGLPGAEEAVGFLEDLVVEIEDA